MSAAAKVLAIIFNQEVLPVLHEVVKPDSVHRIQSQDDFFAQFDNFKEDSFSAVICEISGSADFANEVGQVMRNLSPRTPIFCFTYDKSIFQPKQLKKNGYTDAFLLPLDKESFVQELNLALSPEALAKRAYKRVMAPDLKAESQLNFSTFVFLPLNKKYVQYSGKGETFSERKAEKLKKFDVANLFIDVKDQGQFFDYVATQATGGKGANETEKREKLKSTARGIFMEIFDSNQDAGFDSGRDLLDSCRKMVSTVITGDSSNDFYSKLVRSVSGQSLDYSHATDVSTLSVLFGLLLGVKNIEDLAIAGFLHDISLATFPEEYGHDINPKWNEDLKKEFINHPQQSINLTRAKKMIISPAIEKIILQHHEKFIGGGFPKNLSGDRISYEAQILCLADQYHYAMSPSEGKRALKPREALEMIELNRTIQPEIIRRVKESIKG